MITVGIDPGITGAVAILGHRAELLWLFDMPVMQRGKAGSKVKNQVNGAALAAELRRDLGDYDTNEVSVVVELVHSMPAVQRTKGGGFKVIQGSTTIFSLGHSAGVIEGVVAALRFPIRLVPPAQWKAAMKHASTKEQARALAQRLYPDASIHRVKDHNRAEALLLARYLHGEVA